MAKSGKMSKHSTPPTTGQDAFDKHKEMHPSDPQPMYGRGVKGTGPSNREVPTAKTTK